MANQGCLGFLFNLFGIGGGNSGPAVDQTAPEALPYRLRADALLTRTELAFYQVLRVAVGNAYTICAKVNLADIFETRPFSLVHQNKIDQKHVDFLLCDPASMRPVAGVELDDSSHQRADAQKRDQDKDAAFRAAGLPLIRIQVQQSYDPNQVRAKLQWGMAPGITYEAAGPRQKAASGPVTPTPIVGGRKPER